MVEIDSRIILTNEKVSAWKSSATRDRHMREDPVGWYNTSYSCHLCGRYQDRPIEREEHYKSVHGGAKFVEERPKWSYAEWACHICGDHCDTVEKRTAHYKRYHPHDRVKWNQGQPADAHQIRYLFKPEERSKVPVRNPIQDIGQQGPSEIIDMRNLDSGEEDEEPSVVAVANPVANPFANPPEIEKPAALFLAHLQSLAPPLRLAPPIHTWHDRQAQYQFPSSPPKNGVPPEGEHIDERGPTPMPMPMPMSKPIRLSAGLAGPATAMAQDGPSICAAGSPPVTPVGAFPISPIEKRGPAVGPASPTKKRPFDSAPVGPLDSDPVAFKLASPIQTLSIRSGPSTPSSPKKRKLTVPSGCNVGRQQALERFLRLVGSTGRSLLSVAEKKWDESILPPDLDDVVKLSQQSVGQLTTSVRNLGALLDGSDDLAEAEVRFDAAIKQAKAIAMMAQNDDHRMSIREARFLEKKQALNTSAARLRQRTRELEEREKEMEDLQAQLDAKELELDDREIDMDIKVTAKDDLNEVVDTISVDVDKILGNGDRRRPGD